MKYFLSPILFLITFCRVPCQAQLVFADSSKLADSTYLEHRIKDISDDELLASLNLNLPALRAMQDAASAGDYRKAYEAWASYWAAKQQPHYVSQRDHLLIDTDLLMTYDQSRAYVRTHPDERDTILTRAAQILKHRIRTWGDSVIAFGPVVNFNRDIGPSGKYGFHYWGWSVALNLAFVLTGDQKYLAEFDTLFNQWYEQRNSITRTIPNLDVVYYELGLGTRNREFIEYYLLPYQKRSIRTHERMLKAVLGAARWLYELQRWEGYRPGNWQIHGSYMLTQIAMAFPEFKESGQWLSIGLQRLQEHLSQDFFEDGGHSERAPRNYTLATYMNYRNMYYLLTAYGKGNDLAQHIHRSLGRTIDWWITMLAPTGEIPAINDSWRGFLPVPVLRDGADFFGKPTVYGVMKALLGVSTTHQSPLPSFTSRHMPASGFTVMRTDWSPQALYMNINYGKFAGFHTHNDMLDFEIYAYGKALAVDAGLGLTYDDPLYIPWYQSSRAHNMVVVNDSNITRKGIEGENVKWSSTDSVDYFSGEHDGYASFGVHHRRHIAFIKPEYWFVLDNLQCREGNDTLSWYFHSPTKLLPFEQGFRSSAAPGVYVLPALNTLAPRTGEGWAASTTDKTGGKTELINWIRFDQVTLQNSQMQFPVLLLPFRKEEGAIDCQRASAQHFVVKKNRFVDDLYFPTGVYDDGEVSTDAQFLLVRHAPDGRLSFAVALGTFLRYKGKQLWSSPTESSTQTELSP